MSELPPSKLLDAQDVAAAATDQNGEERSWQETAEVLNVTLEGRVYLEKRRWFHGGFLIGMLAGLLVAIVMELLKAPQ